MLKNEGFALFLRAEPPAGAEGALPFLRGGPAGALRGFALFAGWPSAGAKGALPFLRLAARRGLGLHSCGSGSAELGGATRPHTLRLLFLERVGRKRRHADSGKNP